MEMLHTPIDERSDNDRHSDPLDPRVLSSVLVSVKMAQFKEEHSLRDPQDRLLELMHSPAVRALLDSAQIHARREAISPIDGLQQVITTLHEIDRLWNEVLLKEGLARLSAQYH